VRLDAQHTALLQQLQSLSGKTFDTDYIQAQIVQGSRSLGTFGSADTA
jgi:hypothetical protein